MGVHRCDTANDWNWIGYVCLPVHCCGCPDESLFYNKVKHCIELSVCKPPLSGRIELMEKWSEMCMRLYKYLSGALDYMKSALAASHQFSLMPNGQVQMASQQNLHTKEPQPYCWLDSIIPHRKPLKQRQHGGEEGHDGSILFLPATHTAHASITARQLQIQAAPWIGFVTGP